MMREIIIISIVRVMSSIQVPVNMVTQESEIKLFINAMVAAANVTAVEPEIDFVDRLDPTADVETTRYYATDQSSWIDDQANVLENSMDFYVNVKDYNMVSADLNQDDLDKQEMTVMMVNKLMVRRQMEKSRISPQRLEVWKIMMERQRRLAVMTSSI